MGKLTDAAIKAWIARGERFEGKSDGDGLYLRFRAADATPAWRFRYRLQTGPQRWVNMGSYPTVSLKAARDMAKVLAARVALGHDVAGEKQERKREALVRIEEERAALTVARLCDQFHEREIASRWKHPEIVRSRIENDIKPRLGKLRVDEVKPSDIDDLLQSIVRRGAPTVANDVLRWVKRIFNLAVKLRVIETNPAAAYDASDAGGDEPSRDRWLSRDEIATLFQTMREQLGRFSVQNLHAVRLLLMLACRKEELIAAPWSEFDLEGAVWHLPAARTKTGAAIDIPLPAAAVATLEELRRLGCGSSYLFPAKKSQTRMLPHLDLNTLNAALAKHIRPKMEGVPNFTIHDFRRTARTHLAALGVDRTVAERCLNHKIGGVEEVYNRHDYFAERRKALDAWAGLLEALETGREGWNVVPLRKVSGEK